MGKTVIIFGVFFLFSIAFWVFPNKVKICRKMKPGVTLEILTKEFGAPFFNEEWYYFGSSLFAAGPIRAKIQANSNRVLALKCTEDGPIDWEIE